MTGKKSRQLLLLSLILGSGVACDGSAPQVRTGVYVHSAVPTAFPAVTWWDQVEDGGPQATAAASEGAAVSVEIQVGRRIEFDGEAWTAHLQSGERWFHAQCETVSGVRLSVDAALRTDGTDDLFLANVVSAAARAYGCLPAGMVLTQDYVTRVTTLGEIEGGSLPGGEGRGAGAAPPRARPS